MKTEPAQEFRKLASAFSRLFRCSICHHDYTGEIEKVADASFRNHTNPFCRTVTGKPCPPCLALDVNEVGGALSSGRRAIVKRCHAGVVELVAPVFSDDRLCGCIFAGPFRCGSLNGRPDAVIQRSSGAPSPAMRSRMRRLPELKPEAIDDMLTMTQLLADRLGSLVSASDGYVKSQEPGRRIVHFINRTFRSRQDATLGGLAASMSLSPSRMSRLVKAHTGRSFPCLLSERRVEHAKFLLENTSLKTETVARQCGFSDSAYFFKTFKAIQRETPCDYRKRRQLKRKQP